MPKFKTHKGIKKRIKITGTGRLLHKRAFSSHLLTRSPANGSASSVRIFPIAAQDLAQARDLLGI